MDTCFQSFSSLIHCIIHHALLKFSPCCNASATRLYYGLVLNTREKNEKDEKSCILQDSAVTNVHKTIKDMKFDYKLLRML